MRKTYQIAVGDTFGALTVLGHGRDRSGKCGWHCRCTCGGDAVVSASLLVSGRRKYCGCRTGIPGRRVGEKITFNCRQCGVQKTRSVAHYQGDFCSLKCYGDFNRRLTADNFFASLIQRGECLEFPFPSKTSKYGVFALNGERRAHRVAYTLAFGPIPKGMWVLHRCDNPPCCNPKHLFLGTRRDNIDDMIRKGRQARHLPTNAKLTVEQVREILSSEDPHAALAWRYGVSPSWISKLKSDNGTAWRNRL